MNNKAELYNKLTHLDIDTEKLRVKSRETDQREFKQSFDTRKLPEYGKIMASFANKNGGIIFFGIQDSPRNLLGENNSKITDLTVCNHLKNYYDTDISFDLEYRTYGNTKLLFIVVYPVTNKPVICIKEAKIKKHEKDTRDIEILREGAIYYRYSSSTKEIKPKDLREILDSRVNSIFQNLINNVTLINEVGYDRAAIVDATQLSQNDHTATVYLTNDTANNLNWIEKGRFSETSEDSEKAYYVTKQVEIKKGVEVPVQTDYNETHPLTKNKLEKETNISSNFIYPALWKCGLLNNSKYHVNGKHGKSCWHKFTVDTKDALLNQFPIDMINRKEELRKVRTEYEFSINK